MKALTFVMTTVAALAAKSALALPMPCKGEFYEVQVGSEGQEISRSKADEIDMPLTFEKGKSDRKTAHYSGFEVIGEAGCILDEDNVLTFFPGLMFSVSSDDDIVISQSKAHISQGKAHLKYIKNKVPGQTGAITLQVWNLKCEWEPIQLQECE